MELTQATDIAYRIRAILEPHCERIHIAGSVRRMKPEVKDIEIVCQPKRGKDMFGGRSEENDPAFVLAAMSLGKRLRGHLTQGRYCQMGIPHTIVAIDEGPPMRTGSTEVTINLDLFMPEPHDYFRQLAIRTGSADYSQHVIAKAWRRLGWVGTEDGLRLEKECEGKEQSGGKITWTCKAKNPTLPPEWDSEEAFFAWLKVPFLDPRNRNVIGNPQNVKA